MKCQKCRNELKSTDKSCPECGEKVEQEGITECHDCNDDINNDYISPQKRSKQKLNRKHIKFTVIWVVCCVAAVFAIIFAVGHNASYKKYQLKGMTFQVPSNWDVIDEEQGYYIYDTSYNKLYISSDTYDYLDDDFYNGFISGVKDKFDDCTELSRNYKNVDGVESLNFRFTCSLNETDRYMNIYLIPKNGILYELGFGSYGSLQSSDFNSAESKILNSIDIDEAYTIEQIIGEDATQHSSEKTTETSTEEHTKKTTEKPTEKPTDIVETMTKLFTNDDIVVYYSDCELYSYSEDEVEFHLFIENKTGKSITVQADTVILDGISYNKLVCSDPISANSKGMIEISVEDCTNVNPSTVGADLRYFETSQISDTTHINISSQDVK